MLSENMKVIVWRKIITLMLTPDKREF